MNQIKEQIIYKALSGSKLYGTDNENSDTDIKGIFLPDRKDLILGKAPKHYKLSTGNDQCSNNKDDVDETYYSLHYFLELLVKGETNALDLFFSYTNKQAVLVNTPIWQSLIDNADKIINKNVSSYLGYCKAQAYKYSNKGYKLKDFQTFADFCREYQYREEWQNGGYQVMSLIGALKHYGAEHNMERPMPISEVIKIFGNDVQIVIADNKELYLVIHGVKFIMHEQLINILPKIKQVIASYGKRSEKAATNNGVDYKAISHCVRVLFQAEELLTTGKITFPLKEKEFIKSIKYNTSVMSYDEIMEFIEQKLVYIDQVLKPQSQLREKADMKFIEDFILEVYMEV